MRGGILCGLRPCDLNAGFHTRGRGTFVLTKVPNHFPDRAAAVRLPSHLAVGSGREAVEKVLRQRLRTESAVKHLLLQLFDGRVIERRLSSL